MVNVVQLAEEIYKEGNPESKMDCPSFIYELVANRFERFLDENKFKIKQFCKTGKGCIECNFTGYKTVYGNLVNCECCNNIKG